MEEMERKKKMGIVQTFKKVQTIQTNLSESFDIQNEDIGLPDHSALHLDHKYL